MRLAIDASRTTVARITGTERYALEMIRVLIRLNTRLDITLYFRDAPPPEHFPSSPHVQHKVIPFRRAWTHVRFSAALWADRPDVTWIPAHTLPFVMLGTAAVTVHDLGYRYFPQTHPTNQRRYLDWTTRHSARRAQLVLADSRATADDLHTFYGTAARKIAVIYPGVDAPFIGDTEVIRQKYGLPQRYFIFIGTLQPRKNIARLVHAYARYRAAKPHNPAALVLAGAQGWLYDPSWIDGVDGIHVTGFVEDADKGALYAGALALVFPSLYEGFGFPVLEAMHCHTPVLCSRTSSLPELAGDAALLVDPLNIDEIAEGMARLDADSRLREALRRKGAEQVKAFTWERAAAQALTAFEALES